MDIASIVGLVSTATTSIVGATEAGKNLKQIFGREEVDLTTSKQLILQLLDQLIDASAIFPEAAVQITGPRQGYEGRFFCPRCGSSVFSQTGAEIELHLGSLDAPDQFRPSYELWTIRRESWLPAFDGMQGFARDRADPTAG